MDLTDPPSAEGVRSFWNDNPVCAAEIPNDRGSKGYFEAFDRLRERLEPADFSQRYYRFNDFKGKRVLDVGCGNGWLLERFARAGAETTGVDITPAGVEMSRHRFELAGLPGAFEVADAERLPFPDASFDAVTSMGVLHHTPHPERAVAEIRRVLKQGGRFAIMLYHRNSALYRFKFPILSTLTGKSRRQLVNEVDGVGNPKGDVYSDLEIRALLSAFEVEETFVRALQGWMVIPKLGRLVPDSLFRPLASRWGWFLYASARRPLV